MLLKIKLITTMYEPLLGFDGSLSSGCSIATLSSATNSDPDPECPNGSGRDERGRSVLDERWQHTALQVSVPFLIAGIGTIGAGLVLATVEVKFILFFFL